MIKNGFDVAQAHLRHNCGTIRPAPIIIITNRPNNSSMRKYYQAALFITALVSVVSLLFYRHEYNKLRYVLEVISFFGNRGAKDPDINRLGGIDVSENLHLQFDVPLPSWQRINDDLFVYAAYHANTNEVRGIAFGKTYTISNINCHVFIQGVEQRVLGIFKHSRITNSLESQSTQNLEYAAYNFICEYSQPGIPEGVSFFNKRDVFESEYPILSVQNLPHNHITNDIAICIAPPLNRSISRMDMMTFLNFHQMIGVDHFIVYDYGIPSIFTDTMKQIMNSQGLNVTFTVVPWNFPYTRISPSISGEIAERDCLYRSYNKVKYSITLYWEEYIVLKYHHTLADLLIDFEKGLLASDHYRLDTLLFCTQQENYYQTGNTTLMIFEKTRRFSEGSMKNRHVFISKPDKTWITDNIDIDKYISSGADLINVNHYQYCSNSENEMSYTNDRSISKFAENILNAPIFKQYMTRQSSISK
ncbi:uncharacterized protein LOC124414813 [Diprion similis]|uniref:uncharacterized protein LOC124414813 n=1 Tax=Diprion similis TaxID=362088 RepID=UPI001EF7B5C7|nr:uncharacterized protein LOC124414813 [Diprion similis]